MNHVLYIKSGSEAEDRFLYLLSKTQTVAVSVTLGSIYDRDYDEWVIDDGVFMKIRKFLQEES